MGKIFNNILMAVIWLMYFFMICINIFSDNNVNKIIICCASIVIFITAVIKIKELKKSKLVFISGIFVLIYYIASLIGGFTSGLSLGMLLPIALFTGVIFSEVLVKDKKNADRLVFVLVTILTFVGFISIDMASYELFFSYLRLLIEGIINPDYYPMAFENGVRMKSIITNPNVFASLTVISIFLNLYLYEKNYKRKIVILMLFIDIIALIYSFSLGAILAFIFALLIYLLVNRKNNLLNKLYLIIVTGIMACIAVFIGIKGMGGKGFITIIPLLSIFVCGIILTHLMNKREKFLNNIWPIIWKYKKICIFGVLGLIYFVSLFGRPFQFDSNNTEKNISTNLGSGAYILELKFSEATEVNVTILRQTYEQAGKREYDILYNNLFGGKNIYIPFETLENNKAIKVKLNTENETSLEFARIYDSNNKLIKNLKIDTLILPDFVENRLLAFNRNQNSFQRFTFFADGIKIWLQNPIIGNGINGFGNNYRNVQTSDYTTFSSHNFLIDILCDTGIIGGIVMISLIVYILYLAIKKQQVTDENIVPLLGVIFVYMIGHSMIELNFIYIPYLLTFGIICGIISAQSAKPVENKVFTRINTAIIFLLSISNILLFLIK